LIAAAPPPGCPSDLVLDEVVAGTGSRDTIAEHLAFCERCRSRLDLFESCAARTAPLVQRLLRSASRSLPPPRATVLEWLDRRALRFGLAAGCAAAVVAVAVGLRAPPAPPSAPEEVRIKGSSMRFFRQRSGEVTNGVSGDTFLPGDALRFVVASGSTGWFYLVGIEPSGKVLPYYPYGGERSVPIAGGKEITLPGSLVLDESKGTEYFLGIFSPAQLRLEQIRSAVDEALKTGRPLPRGIDVPGAQHWIVIRKP
jgi:Domain of unknown function (DUF4384)